jgi:hypothetical protein
VRLIGKAACVDAGTDDDGGSARRAAKSLSVSD